MCQPPTPSSGSSPSPATCLHPIGHPGKLLVVPHLLGLSSGIIIDPPNKTRIHADMLGSCFICISAHISLLVVGQHGIHQWLKIMCRCMSIVKHVKTWPNLWSKASVDTSEGRTTCLLCMSVLSINLRAKGPCADITVHQWMAYDDIKYSEVQNHKTTKKASLPFLGLRYLHYSLI